MRWSVVILLFVAGSLLLFLRVAEAPALPLVELDHSRPRPQGGFFRGCYEEPATLNPFTAIDAIATRVVLPWTHDALMDRDPLTAELRPALAESVAVEDDGRTLVFTLREGLRFADGAPVTVDDARFTFEMARQPALSVGALAAGLRDVEAVEAAGPRTLRVQLSRVTFATLPRVASHFRIVQREWSEQAVRDSGVAASPDAEPAKFAEALAGIRFPGPGTGPFRIADLPGGGSWWRPQRDLVLVQNRFCWRRTSQSESWNLSGVELRFDVDPTARFTALRNEEIDWFAGEDDLGDLLRDDAVLRERYERHVYSPVNLGHYFVLWNLRREHLADARVRTALGLLFDREAIARALLGGFARPAAAWFRPGSPEYPEHIEPLPFDPARARELLDEAGYGDENPLEIEILVATERELLRRIVELASPAFRGAGVTLKTRMVDFKTALARLDEGRFDGIVLLKFLDPEVDPFDFFHSSTTNAKRMGLEDPVVDELLERAREELDPTRRRELFDRFSEWLRREQPVTLLVHPRAQLLLHRRFEAVEVGSLGLSPERWWVPPGSRRVGSR